MDATRAAEAWIVISVSGWGDGAAGRVMPALDEPLGRNRWLTRLALALLVLASLLGGVDRGELRRSSDTVIARGYKMTGQIRTPNCPSVKVRWHFVLRGIRKESLLRRRCEHRVVFICSGKVREGAPQYDTLCRCVNWTAQLVVSSGYKVSNRSLLYDKIILAIRKQYLLCCI